MDTKLEVWAPFAQLVSAFVHGRETNMKPDPVRAGWWLTDEGFPEGTKYGFYLDGEGPFPDPRSRSQPDGIHGLSSVTNTSGDAWSDVNWKPAAWEDAVVYEAHVGTFSPEGTFEGMIHRLNELVDLGITHLEIMPVCEFPGSRNWGYDGVSIYAPSHIYGGPHGLKNLIDACHSKGISVIIDVVYNHMGAEGNYLPKFGPYFTGPATAWGSGPTMEGEGSRAVRDFFIGNAIMWLEEYHADGLRLDAIDKIIDKSDKHLLIEMREAVDLLGDRTWPRVLIAESAQNDPIFVKPLSEGGYGMDAHWVDDLHHALRTTFTGERQGYYIDFHGAEDLVKSLRQGFVYDGQYSEHLKKPRGKDPAGLPPSTFLVCFQNHDQIGNRPQGDRFTHHPEVDQLHQKIGAALVLLSPFTPMIFMGEEWASGSPFQFFTDHQDPDLAAGVSKGRKEEFGGEEWSADVPDPQDKDCFLRSKLNWDEKQDPGHQPMYGWYTELIRLRKLNGPVKTLAHVESDLQQGWIRVSSGKYTVIAAIKEGGVETPFAGADASAAILSAGTAHSSPDGNLIFPGRGVVVLSNPL